MTGHYGLTRGPRARLRLALATAATGVLASACGGAASSSLQAGSAAASSPAPSPLPVAAQAAGSAAGSAASGRLPRGPQLRDRLPRDRLPRDRRPVGGGQAAVPAVATGSQAKPLAGKVIGIDPGHNGRNGSDPAYINHLIWNGREWETCDTTGTQTNGGYTEARFNFNVATYLRRISSGTAPAWC